MTENLIDRALILAEKWHNGQYRKGTNNPYIVHPKRVADIVKCAILEISSVSEETRDNMIAAALSHDCLEDTNVSEAEILETTNETVLKLVKELTNPSKDFVPTQEHKRLPRGSIRRIKKQMDRDHLSNVSWEAKLIKLSDRLDNVRDMEGMDDDFCLLYADESQLLLNTLTGTHANLEILLKNEIENLRRKVKERRGN